MEKTMNLIQVLATAALFSTFFGWYGFKYGQESARKDLGAVIDDLRRSTSNSPTPPNP